ncbi:hypothetical protein L596_010742 [Steinernema carpocapsae]|uniref:Uncharacterized protein n=1 Tax=Steinernema carpocapsae TaxID=34508 RepID=A0A4U5PJF5_STECR|nr:hypothetical protein L596_010742 [Steinernema carpocapsae]
MTPLSIFKSTERLHPRDFSTELRNKLSKCVTALFSNIKNVRAFQNNFGKEFNDFLEGHYKQYQMEKYSSQYENLSHYEGLTHAINL